MICSPDGATVFGRVIRGGVACEARDLSRIALSSIRATGPRSRTRCGFENTYQGAIIMRKKHVLLSTAASLAVALVAASLGVATAKAEPGLSGQVTGDGGAMEGVLVSA